MNTRNKAQPPIQGQLKALMEAYRLVVIADEVKATKNATILQKKQALYRASIITVCASLETFLELAVESSLNFLILHSKNSDSIPLNLKLRISKRLNESKDERDIWKISDSKWKSELLLNYQLLKSKFNTPRPQNIDEFLFQTLGVKNMSHTWRWNGNSYVTSAKRLNEFMNIRGDIAHRVFAAKNVHNKTIDNYIDFIYRLSTITSNVLRQYIFNLVKQYPFDYVKEEKLF